MNIPKKEGTRIILLGCDGRTRWQLERQAWGPSLPLQLLSDDRLLTLDLDQEILCHLDLNGNIRWHVPDPPRDLKWGRQVRLARQLPNGNVWIAASNSRDSKWVGEVRLDGSHVFAHQPEEGSFSHQGDVHFWAENGNIYTVSGGVSRKYVNVFDPRAGKSLPPIRVADPIEDAAGVSLLPNDHFLIAVRTEAGIEDSLKRYQFSGQLLDVDEKGKTVRSWPLAGAASGTQLRNGNVLGAGRHTVGFGGWRMVEMDPNRKVVWEARKPFDLKTTAVYQSRFAQPCLELVRLGFDQPRPPDFDLNTSVPYRLKLLKSADAGVRYVAASELQKMGPKAKDAVAALLEALWITARLRSMGL